ncbi:hypothetical protein WDU94_005205 [Cyamophila willieti]
MKAMRKGLNWEQTMTEIRFWDDYEWTFNFDIENNVALQITLLVIGLIFFYLVNKFMEYCYGAINQNHITELELTEKLCQRNSTFRFKRNKNFKKELLPEDEKDIVVKSEPKISKTKIMRENSELLSMTIYDAINACDKKRTEDNLKAHEDNVKTEETMNVSHQSNSFQGLKRCSPLKLSSPDISTLTSSRNPPSTEPTFLDKTPSESSSLLPPPMIEPNCLDINATMPAQRSSLIKSLTKLFKKLMLMKQSNDVVSTALLITSSSSEPQILEKRDYTKDAERKLESDLKKNVVEYLTKLKSFTPIHLSIVEVDYKPSRPQESRSGIKLTGIKDRSNENKRDSKYGVERNMQHVNETKRVHNKSVFRKLKSTLTEVKSVTPINFVITQDFNNEHECGNGENIVISMKNQGDGIHELGNKGKSKYNNENKGSINNTRKSHIYENQINLNFRKG